jgi:hypothetical protein
MSRFGTRYAARWKTISVQKRDGGSWRLL